MSRGSQTIEPVLVDAAVTCVTGGGAVAGVVVGTDRGVAQVGEDGRCGWLPWLLGAHVVAVEVAPATGALAIATVSGEVCLVDRHGTAQAVELGTRVRSLAWSDDGELLAACSQAAGLVVVDAAGQRRFGLPPSRRWRRVAWQPWHPAAPLVVAGAGGASWIDPSTGDVVCRDRTPGVATALAVDPSGPWVALGDLRGEVRLLDVRSEDEVEVEGWPDPVEVLAWMPGTGQLLVAGGDEVTLWRADHEIDADDGIGAHDDELEGDGAVAAAGGRGEVALGAGPDAGPPRTALDGGRLTALAPHPWRQRAAIGSDDGRVAVWDLSSGRQTSLARWSERITALRWDPLGDQLFVGTLAGGGWVPGGEEAA